MWLATVVPFPTQEYGGWQVFCPPFHSPPPPPDPVKCAGGGGGQPTRKAGIAAPWGAAFRWNGVSVLEWTDVSAGIGAMREGLRGQPLIVTFSPLAARGLTCLCLLAALCLFDGSCWSDSTSSF